MAGFQKKDRLSDRSVRNDLITLYLYGIYTLKKGRLRPPEAMQKVMQMSQMLEKADAVCTVVKKRLFGQK